MISEIYSKHFTDSDSNPAGGTTYGSGFAIGWQHGSLGRSPNRSPQNGAFVEDVIQAVIDRIDFYQESKFECNANGEALTYLHRALEVLNNRTHEREDRGVEGTHQV